MFLKYARALSLYLLTAILVSAANVQIRDLATTIVLPAANQYIISDGATQNTGKTLLANFPQVTTTRTALSALSVTNVSTGVTVQTLGGSAIGDGGGSLYYYDSASTATVNGTTVLASASGTGRWLIVFSNSLPAPSVGALGGVFSSAAVANQYITSINTDGTVTRAAVTTANVSGLGTMASQAASAVAITGGTITGLSSPLPVASGGTGASTVAGARANIGAADATTVLLKANNLSDLASAATSRTNLGLGTLATQSGTFSGTSSGTNTGDQTITLTGAITGSGTGAISTSFGAGAITNANLANVATLTLKGRVAAGSGAPTDLTASQAKTLLAITTADVSGLGGAASLNVGTTAGTVAAGNDSRFIPSGGARGSFLAKSSAVDYSVAWQTPFEFNVKNYGAVGDGVTDDGPAINAAIAALTNYSTLYFPQGNYLCTTAINGLSSLTNVTICGAGARIICNAGINANGLVVFQTCSNVIIRDLVFKHNAASRGTGCTIRLYSSNSTIENCLIDGAGEFGILLSEEAGGVNVNSAIDRVTVINTQGDGIHLGQVNTASVTNCIVSNTGDDGIGIIDDFNGANFPQRVLVSNCNLYNIGALGTSGVGIRIDEATDVTVAHCMVYISKEAGVFVGRASSSTDFNARIKVDDCKFISNCSLAGPRGAIWVNFCNGIDVSNCMIDDIANGYGVCFLDCNDLTITNVRGRAISNRFIGTDDSTTTNVAANCYRVIISNCHALFTSANEAFYIVAPSGKTINELIVDGNTANTIPGGNYIYYDRVTTGRIVNNTRTGSQTIGAGGSVSGVTLANNN